MRLGIVIAICIMLFMPLLGFAQPGGTGGPSGGTGSGVTLPDPLGGRDFITILKAIVRFLIIISVPITAVMIIYGAYQIMFAGGDTEKVTTGKRTILYAVAGFTIIILAWSIVAIIQNIIGVSVSP